MRARSNRHAILHLIAARKPKPRPGVPISVLADTPPISVPKAVSELGSLIVLKLVIQRAAASGDDSITAFNPGVSKAWGEA